MAMLDMLSSNLIVLNVFVEGGKKLGDLADDVNESEAAIGTVADVGSGNQNVIEDDDSEYDLEYNPKCDEASDVSLDELDFISDDEFVHARVNLKKVVNVFDIIDTYDVNDDFDDGEEPASEYDESDGDVQSSETDEDDDGKRYRKSRVIYDPKCKHKELKVVIGMQFQDGLECRRALTSWAIETGKHIHFRKVSKTKCMAKCNPPCPWKIYASVVSSDGTFRVKSYAGDHKYCPRNMNNKIVSSKWLAKRYLSVFRVRYDMKVAEWRKDILLRFKTEVSKDRLYKAKKIAQEMVRGSIDAHYASIRRYLAELRRCDRDGRFELLLGDGDVFKGLYVGFSSTMKGFKLSCRPLIGLDGCFLKTYLGGILLCATGKDGNNQMFPIAWAVVEIENEACWTWFLKCLLEDLGITDGHGWTFISDQQKVVLIYSKFLL
ncbi:uncharacterized protein LOC131002270 [Salvia miltiorrhiza]|uniref:uncharacterized protein LOC131002270 n=1 Tax=Salvia miltiorrhiza TaxID=226208 RepID=UPI0025AD1E8A|nr:uncharacterized protein LOC131002270 [Salvia miltiorrhiza]